MQVALHRGAHAALPPVKPVAATACNLPLQGRSEKREYSVVAEPLAEKSVDLAGREYLLCHDPGRGERYSKAALPQTS